MEYFIREMEDKDWEDVLKIYKQGIESGISTFRKDLPDKKSWESLHLKACRFILCHNSGSVVGWAALSPTSSRIDYCGVTEVSIYIDKAHQGKKLGEFLLNKIKDEAEKNGIWTLQSSIFQANKASLKLHKKCGFREVGYREKIAKDKNDIWQNTVLMEYRSQNIY
ncbi:GNAT family N-acetyltransferase [Fusobacterium ulcerans]|uniref:GNAT family N-acetyltransferase n=1 Tax=Fusobacterium ulcerans TaxID=861 RepID=UPI0026EC6E5B|nr:GNAT family N-acetyltransferase [Fusobacterium ulcerans]